MNTIRYWFDFAVAYILLSGFAFMFCGDNKEDFFDAVY